MLVNIASDGEIGATFLSWTLYFLSGKTEYFEFRRNKVLPLSDNPLTEANAHGHANNQFFKFDDWVADVKNRKDISRNDFHVLAVLPTHESTEDEITELVDFYDKNIILTVPNEHYFYHQRYNKRALFRKFADPNSSATDADDQFNDFIEYFFKGSKESWDELGLDKIWDKREFLALNFRPKERITITDFVKNTNKDTFYLDSRDLWCNLDTSINDCFKWMGTPIDQDRYDAWAKVYCEWRKKHYIRVQFGWYFEEIISSIINNNYIDLSRFDLDVVQEAVIQHELIYKYNLNLKTFGLEKFTNTMQLHSLLEQNFHPVDDIYNV